MEKKRYKAVVDIKHRDVHWDKYEEVAEPEISNFISRELLQQFLESGEVVEVKYKATRM